MKPKAFNFYLNYDLNIEALSDEEVGQLIRALLVYANSWENGNGTVPEMSQIVKVAFVPIRKQIDVEFLNYEQKCRTNTENARKRWDGGKNIKGIERKPNHTTVCDRMPSQEKEDKKNENKKNIEYGTDYIYKSQIS